MPFVGLSSILPGQAGGQGLTVGDRPPGPSHFGSAK